MEYAIVECESKTVAGLSIRTNNNDPENCEINVYIALK